MTISLVLDEACNEVDYAYRMRINEPGNEELAILQSYDLDVNASFRRQSLLQAMGFHVIDYPVDVTFRANSNQRVW